MKLLSLMLIACFFAGGSILVGIAVPSVELKSEVVPDAQQMFEAASIKPSNDASRNGGNCHGADDRNPSSRVPLGRCYFWNLSLAELINNAYRSGKDYDRRIVIGPNWVNPDGVFNSPRFTIEAKAEDPSTTTREQLLQMLQGLLADRFKLKFHWEAREIKGLALVVGKEGAKLQPHADGHSTGLIVEPGSVIGGTEIKTLAGFLSSSQAIGQTVIDRTGLSGMYDFTLKWAATVDSAGPSLPTALQEQLGLRLENQTITVEVIVIDSAERPTQN